MAIIIGIASYYLFFVQPDLIDTTITSSQNLKAIDNLQSLQFNSTGVVNEFTKHTKQFVPIPSSPNTQGNTTPFGVQ